MPRKSYLDGYKNEEDYFANAPVELLQKHYIKIEDFETSMIFQRLLMQYRNPWPLLTANYKIYDQLGIDRG
jgi:hypothetical protein